MARGKHRTHSQPLTTAQRLSSIVKSCRDNMRRDKGLNGDLDRLPMLTCITFLKFLDDMEEIRRQEQISLVIYNSGSAKMIRTSPAANVTAARMAIYLRFWRAGGR
jgi:hypothetical protein